MSDNPFDVFAADFKAAIPTVDDKTTGNQAEPINIMAPAPTAPVPVMNAPAAPAMNQPPQQTQQPGMMNGGMGMMNNNQGMYGGGYQMNNGMQQAPYGGAAMGAPAPMGGPPAMGAPAPMGAPPAMGAPAPMGGPPAMGAPPAPMGAMTGGVATQGALVASAQPSNPYAMNMGGMPYGQQPPAQMAPSPYGAPPAGPPAGYGMPPSQFGAPSPYGAPPPGQQPAAAPPTEPSFSGAPAVVQPAPAGAAPQQFGAPVPQPDTAQQPPPVPPTEPEYAAPPSSDPFSGGMPAAPVPPAPVASNDPFGVQPPPQQPPQQQQQQQQSNPWEEQPPQPNDALVQVPNQSSDPFGVFDSTPTVDTSSVATPAPTRHYTQAEIGQLADDPWDATPFGGSPTNAPSTPANAPAPGAGGGSLLGDDALVPVAEEQHKAGELPPGGEWYDARIFTPTLGVMFFKPQELTDSLFLQTERTLVDSLDDRPVVAFIVEGSSARAAGVELGHVLLKVNGIDVKNPKEASRLIKEGPRPLPLLFYVPDTSVVVAEGEHMVKYDTRETMAPNSAKDWKPKYVVIGGIIAQPWMMNMYRSKSEYDIAVIETQARRPVSVKVKQFSLQGARIQNDWQGPQMVKYKNKLHPWKYVVVLPVSRNPIKISSPNLAQLKPVHEGVRRVLMAQQRYAPSPSRGDPYGQGQQRPPSSDPYGQQQGQQQYGGPPGPPQHHPQQQQQAYGGGGQYGAPGGYDQSQANYNQQGGAGSVRRSTAY